MSDSGISLQPFTLPSVRRWGGCQHYNWQEAQRLGQGHQWKLPMPCGCSPTCWAQSPLLLGSHSASFFSNSQRSNHISLATPGEAPVASPNMALFIGEGEPSILEDGWIDEARVLHFHLGKQSKTRFTLFQGPKCYPHVLTLLGEGLPASLHRVQN